MVDYTAQEREGLFVHICDLQNKAYENGVKSSVLAKVFDNYGIKIKQFGKSVKHLPQNDLINLIVELSDISKGAEENAET